MVEDDIGRTCVTKRNAMLDAPPIRAADHRARRPRRGQWGTPAGLPARFYREGFRYAAGLCPSAEFVEARLVSQPLFPVMNDVDQDDVLHALDKVFAHYAMSDATR